MRGSDPAEPGTSDAPEQVIGAPEDPSDRPARRRTDGLRPALIGFVAARCCIAIGYALAHTVSAGSERVDRYEEMMSGGLLSWDGFFYKLIANGGYEAVPRDGVRFFPLYPVASRLLGDALGVDNEVTLLLIANLSALVGAVVLWRLVVETFPANGTTVGLRGRPLADRSAWMVAIVPASLVFAMSYTEGPSLALTAGTLLALHRRNWWWVAVLGFSAALLRPTGILLAVPVLVTLVMDPPPAWRHRLVGLGSAAAPGLGLLTALAWIERTTGDFMAPVTEQSPIRGDLRNPLIRGAEALWGSVHGTDIDVAPYVVLWPLLLVVAVWRKQPWSWIAFAAVTLLTAMSADVIGSLGRYGLVCVPLVVALAQWAQHRWQQVLVGCVGSIGLIVTTFVVIQGRVVP